MKPRKAPAALALAALLGSCGDGGTSSGGTSIIPTPTPTPTSTTAAGCSLRQRQDWALAQLQEWYLFPTLLERDDV